MKPTEPYGLSGHPMVWHGRPDEGVADLTVMYDPLEDVSRSMWRPTPGELEALKRGYPVILEVFGQHPPVNLYVPWEGQLRPDDAAAEPVPEATRAAMLLSRTEQMLDAAEGIARERGVDPASLPTIFGVPVVVDDGVTPGLIQIRSRVDLDAAFRRAGEAQGFA